MDNAITRAEHLEFVRRMEDEHKRISHRLEVLEKSAEAMVKMSANVERLAVNMENMIKEQGKQGERLEVLEQKPVKRWENVTGTVLNWLLTAALAALVVFK